MHTARTRFNILNEVQPATRTWLLDHQDQIVAEHTLPRISLVLIEP